MGALRLAGTHEFVKPQAGLGPIAETQPTNACGQTLEGDAFLGHSDPTVQVCVLRKELEQFAIAARDVLRVAGERCKTERTAALAKKRTDKRGHKTREIESVVHARALRHGADIISVIENDGPVFLKREHGAHVLGHSFKRAALVAIRIALAQNRCFF